MAGVAFRLISPRSFTLMDVTLILFCKRPRPGIGKQRLARSLGQDAAYRIAELLHGCALAQLASWPGHSVVAAADASDCDWYRDQHPWIEAIVAQRGENLGQRINRLDRVLRAAGHQQQIIIGSDMPEQTPQQLLHAAELLERYDVVLSAADDGGVTLMAARKPWPDLSHLPWSSGQLGEALVNACEREGLAVGWVEPCADVDLVHDLRRLTGTLANDSRAPQQALCKLIQEII